MISEGGGHAQAGPGDLPGLRPCRRGSRWTARGWSATPPRADIGGARNAGLPGAWLHWASSTRSLAAGAPAAPRSGAALDSAKLEVVYTLQRIGGALRLVPPKTEDSARTGSASPVCVDALWAHRERQEAERAEAGSDWEDHGFVFPSRRGRRFR